LSAEGATGERGTGGSLASLRAIREKKGVSLEQASEDLELSVIYLEFIEGGHIERLPGPGYARSMLTMYAEYLGLDSAKVLSRLQLEECFASPAFEPPTSESSTSQDTGISEPGADMDVNLGDAPKAPSPRGGTWAGRIQRVLVVLVMLGALLVAFLVMLRLMGIM